MSKNPELELAVQFIEKTDRNLFITGKAGTGKTTFLHQIKKEIFKKNGYCCTYRGCSN